MSETNETVDDIVREMNKNTSWIDDSPGKRDIPKHGLAELLRMIAHCLDAAVKREIPPIERIVRDAIISYTEQYVNAPNDETEREIQHRAEVANEWLRQHGFAEEPTNWSKEEIPCL